MATPTFAADPGADQLYQSAVTKYGAADYQGAIKDAEAAVALDPGNWQAWQVDGNARYALGDQTGALTVYRYALQGNPNNPQLKAFVDSLAGSAAPAAAVTKTPAAQGAYETALAQCDAGNYDAAMQGAAAVVRADPNHWQAWQLLGNSRYARGDKRGALEAYDRSLAIHPDNPEIRSFALRTDVAAPSPPAPSAVASARQRGVIAGPSVAQESPFKRWGIAGQLGPPLWVGVMIGYRPTAQVMVNGGFGQLTGSGPPSSLVMVAVSARYDLSSGHFKPYLGGGYNLLRYSQEGYVEQTSGGTSGYYFHSETFYPAIVLTVHAGYALAGIEYEWDFGLGLAAEIVCWQPLATAATAETDWLASPVVVAHGFVCPNLQLLYHF